MLHVFSDRLEGLRSGFAHVPVTDLLLQPSDIDTDVLSPLRSAALAGSAFSPDLTTQGAPATDKLVVPAADFLPASRTHAVDADGFDFHPAQTNPAIALLPPVGLVSPPQADEVAFLAGVNAAHVIVPTSFATWNTDPTPTNPATYNAVSSAAKWGAGAAGTAGGTVTYFFDAASAWSPTEQAVFVAAYALWSDVANIQFAPAADAASANILIRRGAPGSGAFFSGGLTGSGGAGTVGTTNIWHFQSTGAFINLATADTSFGPVTADPNVAGGHVWSTIVHEEGHSLGLGHGGPYNGDVDPATQQFSAQDTTLWTIMSYIDPGTTTAKYFAEYPVTGTNWGTSADFFARSAETPMMLDIQAAQQLYGAPTVTAYSGGQVFGFNCNITDASKPFFDFTVNTNPVVTIWDAGANNALDLSGFSAASNVNLNAGTFSSCDGMVNNIAIAAGTAINAFVGGPGNDTVLGNDNGDLITSGAGNDALTGGAGNDGFFFGAFYTAGDTVNGGGGTNNQIGLLGDYSAGITLSGAQIGNIQVLALQPGFNYVLTLTDDLVSTGTFSVWSVSMTSANSVNVNASAETSVNYSFFMGQGNDTVAAGSGNDLIYGEGGKDTLRGGPGNDTFAYLAVSDSTGVNFDLLPDFSSAADKIKLGLAVGAIDATINGGVLATATFDANLSTAVNLTNLAAGHAVLFNPTGPDYAGHTFLIVDANGQAGYQAGADYVFDITGGSFGTLSTANFI